MPPSALSFAPFPINLHVIYYNYTDLGGISPVPAAISTPPASISPRKSGICRRAGSAAHGPVDSYRRPWPFDPDILGIYRRMSDTYPDILDIFPSSGESRPMNLGADRSSGPSHPGFLGICARDLGISPINSCAYPRLGTVSPDSACVCRRPASISLGPGSNFSRPACISKFPGSVVSDPAGIFARAACASADLGRIYFRPSSIFSRPRSSFWRPAWLVRVPGSAQTTAGSPWLQGMRLFWSAGDFARGVAARSKLRPYGGIGSAGRLALTDESACLRPGRESSPRRAPRSAARVGSAW
jgi:hypothetical protein